MNPCTCEAERGRAERLLEAWDDARNEYREAFNKLADLQITLRTLTNQWIDLTCWLTGALHPSVMLLCGIILYKRLQCSDRIDEQEPIVEDKKKHRDKMKDYYYRAQEEYMACKNSLKACAGCGEEVKPECIKTCKGCGRDYCNTCFDAGIEAWEMKQKEK